MENAKNWLKSKTIMALIALLIPLVSKFLGFDIGAYITQAAGMVQNHATISDWINFILALIPVLVAAYGRITAKKQLTMSFKK